MLGVHSLVWDEARCNWSATTLIYTAATLGTIQVGDHPEFEFGVQLLYGEDELTFPFGLSRLGGPKLAEIPSSWSVPPVRNNQRCGLHRTQIDHGRARYFRSLLGLGSPVLGLRRRVATPTIPNRRLNSRKMAPRHDGWLDDMEEAGQSLLPPLRVSVDLGEDAEQSPSAVR